jgi:putative endonuclease
MAHLYILFSTSLNKFYIGHTTMLPEQRLHKHLTNHDGFTAKAKDWLIVYLEKFDSKEDAHHRELKIKSKKSRKYIEGLIAKGV